MNILNMLLTLDNKYVILNLSKGDEQNAYYINVQRNKDLYILE